MKSKLSYQVLPFLALPLLTASALGQATGVSRPDQLNDPMATSPAQADHYVKPSHAADTSQGRDGTGVAQAVPAYASSYPATGPVPAPITDSAPPTPTPGLLVRQPLPATAPTNGYGPTTSGSSYAPVETARVQPEPHASAEDDSGIVMEVPVVPHTLNSGTVLKARLNSRVDTQTTAAGTSFTAELLAEAGHSGEVLLPVGSVIHGRVAVVHGGKRIGGRAAILLQPETVTLPDGSIYPLRATLSDLDGTRETHVNNEGVVQPKSNTKVAIGALGLTTGSAAVAGALIGGGVGAVVGAGIGAGIGTYLWLARDHQESLPSGTTLFFSLQDPLQLNPR